MAIFETMQWNYKTYIAISIIPQIFFVKIMAGYPQIIEQYYSLGLYPYIASFSRALNGWIPFSIGDCIYTFFSILILRYCYKNWKHIKSHKLLFLRDSVAVLAGVYFCFHLLWGLNYYRQPIAHTLELEEEFSFEELVSLSKTLIIKTNQEQFNITKDSSLAVVYPYSTKEMYSMAAQGYHNLALTYPHLSYTNSSVKSSIYSLVISYTGYGGYLNPFTNEAQVNGKIPLFKIPITSTHEMGHQIGYAAENETNFVGYLAATAHSDPYFNYSAHAFALQYCLSTIYSQDQELYKSLIKKINAGVKKNYNESTIFWNKYKNPTEPIFKAIYSNFLKSNGQVQGILSYRSVVGLLVIYHREHPL